MRAVLDNLSRVDDIDVIGFKDRREPMCDDKRRTADHKVIECCLHDLLALRIECRSRFVENQDTRIFENRTRDRDALPLSPRQIQPALTDSRVIALRELVNKSIRICRFRRRLDFLIGRIKAAVADVLPHRR